MSSTSIHAPARHSPSRPRSAPLPAAPSSSRCQPRLPRPTSSSPRCTAAAATAARCSSRTSSSSSTPAPARCCSRAGPCSTGPRPGARTHRTDLVGTIQPGEHFLVAEATGAGGTVDLPTPDPPARSRCPAPPARSRWSRRRTTLGLRHRLRGHRRGLRLRRLRQHGQRLRGRRTGALPEREHGIGHPQRQPAPTPTTTRPTSSRSCRRSPTNAAGETAQYPPPAPCDGATPVPHTIPEVQGVGHLSAARRRRASRPSGVTTAVSGNGYWIQDPAGDGDPRDLRRHLRLHRLRRHQAGRRRRGHGHRHGRRVPARQRVRTWPQHHRAHRLGVRGDRQRPAAPGSGAVRPGRRRRHRLT